MKITGVFVVLVLSIYVEDVTSQAKYQEGMCIEFQPFLENGNLYCNRDIDPVFGPDGKRHTNKCVMCREVLRKRRFSDNGGRNRTNDFSSEKDVDCSEYWPYFSRMGYSCTRENNPVRDASGKQHSNKCMMCLQRFKNGGKMNGVGKRQPQNGNNERGGDDCYEYRSQMGPDGELSCTRENDPVRDASGNTHSNKCIMCARKFKKEMREGRFDGGEGGGRGGTSNANGERVTQGTLSRANSNENNCNQYGNDPNNPCSVNDRIAQGDYRSYTNCGGIGASTYHNDNCQKGRFNNRQKRQAASDHKLDCSKLLATQMNRTSCSAIWAPVCGNDGKTYSNKCFLCLEIGKSGDILSLKHEGECPEVVHGMVDCSRYPQTRGKLLCKSTTHEVCGTDGETHSNECMLCNRILKTKSQIGIKNIGPCQKMEELLIQNQ
nr:serine protease inhibitor Kazal-type 5-like [Anolis sagrei ordinatus]